MLRGSSDPPEVSTSEAAHPVTMSGCVGDFVVGADLAAGDVRFVVINGSELMGEYLDDTDGGFWAARTTLISARWRFVLDQRRDMSRFKGDQKWPYLYGFTHVGQLVRLDGAAIAVEETGSPPITPCSHIAVGIDAASELGVSVGEYLTIAGSTVFVAQVVDATDRAPWANRWIFTPNTTATTNTCWFEAERTTFDVFYESTQPMLSMAGLEQSTIVSRNAGTRDPVGEFLARPQRTSWIAVGAVLAFLGLIGAWSSRGDVGLYRVYGLRRWQTTVLQWFQFSIPISLGGSIGMLWAITAVWIADGTSWGSIMVGLTTGALSTLAAVILLWPAMAWIALFSSTDKLLLEEEIGRCWPMPARSTSGPSTKSSAST